MITTNFDPSLENALSAENPRGRPPCLHRPRSGRSALFQLSSTSFGSRPRGHTTEFVLHLHGVHNHPERVVLAASDYSKRYGDFTSQDRDGLPFHRNLEVILRKVIWALLVTYPTLFVGFSLNDPALRHILGVTSADFQRGRHLDHYAIVGARVRGGRAKAQTWRGNRASRRSSTASCARKGLGPDDSFESGGARRGLRHRARG